MEDANDQLNSARQGAMKVVIVFTDGDPTSGNSFENEVAADAINTAHAIKQDKGATVYTIGIFSGANPNTDNNANNYMNAMSSNYPTATAEGDNGGWFGGGAYFNITWGDGSRNDGYYKSATNSEELNKVFEEISEDITTNAGSGSPIEGVTQEGELNPGTLTFTDTLGSYMTVSGDTMTVVYGDRMFTSTGKNTAGNVDTYHFEGTVAGNAVYGSADLSALTVTVAHGATLADGDVVTVQIPASLIPMRHYDVDSDAKTMSVTPAYPIRLFYGVSVKADAKAAINQGYGDDYDAIVNTNKTDDGKVAFYSNFYSSGSGDTTATFTPSDGNKFYYYTQDTNLYVDQNCTQRATTWNINSYDTLYYSEPYWEITSGNNAQEVTHGIAINRDGQDWSKMTTDRQGNYYIPAGTQRLDRPASLNANKTNNETGTATTVLTPNWEGAGVAQHLGNNGKITYDLPGELEIKKSVDWGNASDDTKQNQNSFEFTINFDGDETLDGSFTYDVYETDERPVRIGTVANGGTITLEDGQRAVIKGLPSGTTFTVTETEANKDGFTTTDTVTADPNNDTTDGIANGTIAGGSQQSVSFQNNYKADEPLTYNVSDGLSVEKVLEGRDWRDGDEFTFNVQALDGYAPTQTEVTINKDTPDHKASFGTITFDKDGEFRYVVREDNDTESPIVGIDYSNATYRLTVKVVDAGNGELKIESTKLEMFQDDTGAEKEPAVAVEGTTATFTNYYLSDKGAINIDGKKAYNDTTDANPIAPNKFQFKMEALGGYVTDGGSRDNLTVSADNTPKPTESTQGNVTTIGNVGNEFHMPTIYFDGNDVGNTYVYKITEVPGNEDGMTYDTNSYEVEVKVTEEPDPEAGDDHVHILATANKTPEQLTFTNKYEPTAAELTGDDVIHGTKTLEGRQMKEGETFYFQLSALNDNAKTILADPQTVTVTDQNAMDFAFNEMKFTKVGTYTFQVNEVADDKGTETTNGDGMTFDTNICTVTVTVTDGNDSENPDDHGKLLASVSYSNDKHSNVTDHAQFTNVYEASMDYGANGAGGIAVTKTIIDRTMDAGDYSFTLTGTGPDGELTETFENTAAAANGTVTMKQLQSLTFDEQDAEKTFSFTVDEADPTDENRLAGVEYDQSQYRVDITVHDNHDGTMYTETTVTKLKNADGTEVNEVVVDKLNSSTAQGQVPTFGFENVYKPTEASLEGETALQVTKEVTGAASPDGVNYTFTLTAQDTKDGPIANIGGLTEGKLTTGTSGVINGDATDNTDDDTQTVSFDKLTFSEPGTYTFTVQEDQPAADDGWTFDDADGNGVTDEHTVTVEVSYLNENNEYDGALHIKSVTPQDPTVITNSYKANPVIVGGEDAEQQITVQKSVTGADSTAEFTFRIEPVIDDNHTEQWWRERVKGVDGFSPELTISGVTQAQAVTNNFAGIQFSAVGEYKFYVTEVGAADFNKGADRKGWTYDEHTATVTVKVTDVGNDGQLDAEVIYDNTFATTDADKAVTSAAAFTNKYAPAEVTTGDDAKTGIQVTKKVTGHDAIEEFEFSLSLADGQNNANVFEGSGDSKIAFDGMTLATSENIKAGATETKTFDDITFTAAGDYKFVIDEITEKNDSGWTYDAKTVEITVHVKDDGEGKLYIEGIDNNAPEFVNAYQLQPAKFRAAYFQLQGNKVLDGRNWEPGDEFTFTLTAGEGDNVDGSKMDAGEVAATMPTSTSDTIRPADNDGSKVTENSAQFTFTDERYPGQDIVPGQDADDTFTYTKPGTYRYLISEINPNVSKPGSGIIGVSYDQTTYRLVVEVTDNNDGTMSAQGTYYRVGDETPLPGGSTDVTFTNKYSSNQVEINFNAFKVLQGRETNMEDDEFTFHMEFAGWAANDANADPNVDDDWALDDTTNAPEPAKDDGNIIRGDITFEDPVVFTSNNVGYTYRYAITEVHGGETIAGVTYDNTTKYVTAKVTSVQQANDDGTYTEYVRVETTGEAEWNDETDTAPTTGAIFTNTYSTTGTLKGDEAISVTKIFTGRENDQWLDTDTFQAMLTAVGGEVDGQTLSDDNVPMPDGRTGGVATVDLTKDAHENVAFGEITYSRPGTYIYTLTEVEEHKLAGVEYSQAEYEVVVTAEDNHDGTMTVISKITPVKADNGTEIENAEPISGAAEFTNTYSVAETSIGGQALAVTKNLSGRSWFDSDEFTFTLAAGEDNGVTQDAIDAGEVKLPAETEITISGSTEGHTVTFDAITFTKAGTYTFKVTESGKIAGVTNDEDVDRTFVVSVVDNNDGTLTASIVAEQSENLVFNNTYKAEPVTLADVTVQKTLVDRNWAEGEEYTFTIVNTQKPDGIETAPMPVDDNGNVVDTITVGKPADGNMNTASFGKMTFSQAGTYVYEIKETAGTDETMTYDGHTAVLTVNVFEDQSKGELWIVRDKINGATYDNTGALNADDAANTSVAAFTNTQKLETTLDITGTKEIAGDRNFQTGDSFTFTVTADNGAPMPDGVDGNGTITISPAENTSSAEINFGTITFTQAGEYVYHIVEVAGGDKDMTYDTAVRDIIVTVTNDNNGHLDAQITTGADQLTWTNTWTFPGTTYASLNGIKYLTGKELTEGMFTFQVEPQNGAPMGETLGYNDINGDTIKVEDGVWSASITLLKNIPFDKVGEYTYIITEKIPDNGENTDEGEEESTEDVTTIDGITYDTTQYRVTLTVKWDGTVDTKIQWSENGTMWADANGIAFNNSYATEGTAKLDGVTALAGTKTLSGRDWTDKDSFTFILEMTEGNEEAVTMPGDLLAVVQGAYSDGAQVPFSFGDIEFFQIGDYTFTIREQQPGEDGFVGQTGGMTYDNHTRTIKVNVFDNGAGKLEAKVVSDEGGSNWTNVYDADTPAELIGATDLAVTKVIDGREWLEDDSFTFTLIPGDKETEEAVYGNEAAGIAPTVTMPVGEDASITITSATENHTNNFGNITFTEPGNYSFKIAEEGEDHDGLVYDKNVRTVKVSVTDNLDGTLSAKVVGITPEAGLTFTNKYDTTGDEELDGATNLAVVKNLTGRDWQEGDVFTFQLAAGDGDTASAIKEGKVELSSGDTTEQITVTNEMVTEEGVHTNHFGSITFHETGTYTFTVTEQPSTMPGVTNDADADRTVVVSVIDNNEGELVASVVADESEQLTFTNTYKPGSTTTGEGSVNLSGKKDLKGRDLVAGEFTFLITAGDDATSAAITDGTVVLPVENPVNKADGSFSFGDITFDAAGTYMFNISEMIPQQAAETGTYNGVTYDRTVYTVTIEVKDNTVAGKLEIAGVTGIPEGGMVFTNTFTPQGQSTAVVPSITKNYTGHDLAAGQGDFAFKVVNNADATDVYNGVVKMTAAGTATVDVEPIYYDADDMTDAAMDENGLPTKTFTYTISEVNGGKDGVVYDKATYTMTVVVSVNADGSFAEPVVSYTNAAGDALEGGVVFYNSYSAANPASYKPYGTKATNAQDDTKDNTNLNAMRFSFEVVDDATGKVVSVGTSNANDDITFEEIKNITGEGTHTYTIREVNPDTEGVTMDTTTYKLSFEVADDGAGSFYVVPGSEVYTNNATGATSNGANFTNVYNGGVVPLVLSVTKDLDGRALNAGEFGFTLYDYTGDVKGAPLAYGVNDANGNVTFGSINYYYDKVVTTPEEDADQADQTEETTDAEQAEDQTPAEGEQAGEGTETTTPETPDASGDGTAADNQPETGTGSATDEGATDQTGNGDQTGDVSGEGAGTTTPETPDAFGEATGDGTTDTGMTDQGVTDTTDVSGAAEETAPVEETPAATEEVATESEAPAEVATLSDEPANPVADVASFLAPEIAIADDVAAEQYELEPLPETVVVDETAAAESTGATTAEPVEQVVSTDLGWHRYLIEENAGDLGGVSYDQSKFIVDVLVSDKVDENGVPLGEIQATVEKIVKVDANYANPMEVTVSGGDGMDNVVFHNTYKVTEPSYVTITGTKTLAGRDMTENDKFTFSVYDANGNEVATGISKLDGSIDFTSIEVNGAAESTYTVKENHAGETINGVTYSEQVFEFTIKSWDNGNGGWDYEVVYPEGGIAFTNDYSIQGDGILVGFEGTKTLTGRDMEADEFGFAVYDANGEKVAGGQNTAAADGEASALELGKVIITEPGEYEYTIAENAGTAGGVTYDGRTFTAQVKVWDNGMGALEYEVTYPDGPVAFENTYGLEEGAKVEVIPVATKTLTGRALADGEFTFAVTDADGKTVSTGTNDASGNVNFTPITFTETGTYTYTISEVNGRQDTITYDDATFGLVVTIADDGQGGLVAADVNYANGTPAFANVYEEPEKPVDPKPAEPEVPKTGDDGMNLAGAAALGLGGLGAALVGGGALLRRRASR